MAAPKVYMTKQAEIEDLRIMLKDLRVRFDQLTAEKNVLIDRVVELKRQVALGAKPERDSAVDALLGIPSDDEDDDEDGEDAEPVQAAPVRKAPPPARTGEVITSPLFGQIVEKPEEEEKPAPKRGRGRPRKNPEATA